MHIINSEPVDGNYELPVQLPDNTRITILIPAPKVEEEQRENCYFKEMVRVSDSCEGRFGLNLVTREHYM
jgi:hypothetical protein